jgi:ABC-type transport system involved in multi-copper enzyme maturation permease subunit
MAAGRAQRIWTLAGVVWLEMLRRKDVYILLILLAALLGYLLSLEFFGSTAAVRYIWEVGLLLAWLFSWILTISLVSRQIPNEERTGTVFPLLSKPVSRNELLIGKWFGGWTAASVATAAFYGAVTGVVLLRGGDIEPITLVQGFVLHAAMLAILAALSLALSTFLTREAALTLSYIAAVVCFLFVPRVAEMLVYAEGPARVFVSGLYYGLPHFELFDMRRRMVHGWGAAPWSVVAGVLLYAVVWTAGLLFASAAVYRNKSLRRDLLG